jgi:hypothetical protein
MAAMQEVEGRMGLQGGGGGGGGEQQQLAAEPSLEHYVSPQRKAAAAEVVARGGGGAGAVLLEELEASLGVFDSWLRIQKRVCGAGVCPARASLALLAGWTGGPPPRCVLWGVFFLFCVFVCACNPAAPQTLSSLALSHPLWPWQARQNRRAVA